MATITLKRIPPRLHRALKQRAARNHRSLNSEILSILELAVATEERDVDSVLLKAKRFRESLKFTTTPEEIDAAKREGRGEV